jgi:hypothetical protein
VKEVKAKQETQQQRPMTDLLGLLSDMRNGAVISDLNRKFNDLVAGVLDTGKGGKMVITLSIAPQKFGMGGVVLEVSAEHKVKLEIPELAIGSAVFFATDDGVLTREDPNQERMFALDAEKEKK